MADWLINGLTATISGVVTVFVVLILVAAIISQLRHVNRLQFSRIFGRTPEKNTLQSRSSVVEATEERETDDLELVAVITAAIAASMNTTADKLMVRSIRRVKGRK